MASATPRKPDIASVAGVALALAGIVGGLLLEGGRLSDIAQYTAAIIVVGGTMGAVMLNNSLSVLLAAFGRLGHVFFDHHVDAAGLIEQILKYASKARKEGIVSLEQEADQIANPFLKKALTLAVDGTDLQEIRNMMELELALTQEKSEAEARVFEQAGGYAPTVGIIGAVMGLIQVMKNLANIDEVGHGIAVAFVATVYGVGLANLFFLPVAGKIKARTEDDLRLKNLMLEGVIGIVEGLNPKLIRVKLEAYLDDNATRKAPADASAAAPDAAKPEASR